MSFFDCAGIGWLAMVYPYLNLHSQLFLLSLCQFNAYLPSTAFSNRTMALTVSARVTRFSPLKLLSG